jgi:hypothetical protein
MRYGSPSIFEAQTPESNCISRGIGMPKMNKHRNFESLSPREFLIKLERLNTAVLDGSAARHKPILLLVAMNSARQGKGCLDFRQAELEALPILESSLGTRNETDIAMPFWHLQSDGIWKVFGADDAKWRSDRKRPLTTELRRLNVTGKLPPSVIAKLVSDAGFATEACRVLCAEYWGNRDVSELVKRLNLPMQAEGRRTPSQ